MKINCISKNQNFNANNNKRNSFEIRKIIPSQKAILLSSALLASAVCAEQLAEEKISTNNTNFSISVEEANKLVIEYNRKKEIEEEEKKFSWDKIPDYEKLLWIFYSGLGIIFLMNILTDNNNRPENPDKFN